MTGSVSAQDIGYTQTGSRTISCPMCGSTYDRAESASSCQSCPLVKGCQLVRCPACGFETVDPASSGLARLAQRWFRLKPGG